ncbi:MAG: Transporter, stomatin/podocin/band 7/nephrosis.2/spfh [Candidatus Magasanikbacteria bacterium GW2011_GWA2_56_11]|uniref:Transporter, stomatin/podocin/band 7/nephrosis.2/spfh n=1 Tax=Candidatus Magasanikbacteria bacterium GW2011_GWA2_56_11 TaxID=1619044 RepID=A0A0G1YD17_9BACT|nr:MAG: Transporter, stomatin/podocin/band 7/nephrosis.2/spfh [Candidatus Magasanikbacteria bacterium GW2011_GWA2_56_11]
MSESLDKLMYSFVMEDVLKGLFIYVPPGYVACVYDLGRGVLKKVLTPGLHFKIPFWQKAKLFNTQTLEYSISRDFNPQNEKAMGDVPIGAVSLDAKKLAVEGTLLLRLDIHQIPHIWQTIGEDFVAKIIRPTVRSRIRMVASRFEAGDIVGPKRDAVEMELKNELERIFYPRGIYVENVLLSDVSPITEAVKGKIATE